MATIGTPWMWIGFVLFVLAMLALDLGVLHRRAREVSVREATVWSAIWIALAGVFGLGVHFAFGKARALEFATGFVVEKALAVDNIFVFIVIFGAFGIRAAQQHRILVWGVLGALVMRAAFIVAGGALVQRFHATLYFFGAILALTGIKLLVQREREPQPERNPILRMIRRIFPVADEPNATTFTVVRGGRRFATPLLLALLAVEVTDLIFAVDSIPAIFGITEDPFIVFTSNIFAILGLRSLYFALAGAVQKLRYLKTGLALVLVFVGMKLLASSLYVVPVAASLGVIGIILSGAVFASLWVARRPPADARAPAPFTARAHERALPGS